MNLKNLILLIVCIFVSVQYAQVKVLDVTTNNTVPDVSVTDGKNVRHSNSNGEIDLSVFSVGSTITFSHVAYHQLKTKPEEIEKGKVYLTPVSIKLNTVEVMGNNEELETGSKELITLTPKTKLQYQNSAEILKFNSTFFIKDYGGYAGLKTVSSRGLSSENTLVLFNEARVNDIRTGTFDFSALGSNTIDGMEFIKTSNEDYYGPATGGVVKIVTSGYEANNYLRYGYKIGSYNSQNHSFGAYYKYGKLGIKLSAERAYGKNDYRFMFEDNKYNRTNAHYSKTYTGLTLQYTENNGYLKIYSHYSALDNGIPGFVLTNNINSGKASNNNSSMLSVLNGAFDIGSRLKVSGSLSYHGQEYIFSDPKSIILLDEKNQESELRDFGASAKLSYKVTELLKLNAGIIINRSEISGLPAFSGNNTFSREVSQDHSNLFVSGSFVQPIEYGVIKHLVVNAGIAFQYLTETLEVTRDSDYKSYKAGAGIIFRNIPLEKIKFSFSDDVRFPTVNERYYSAFYDYTELNKEHYRTIEVGSEWCLHENIPLGCELNIFKIVGDDKIVWVPFMSILQVPRNISSIESRGVEFILKNQLFDNRLSTNFTYTYTDAKNLTSQGAGDNSVDKQLVYSPKHKFNFNITANFKLLYLSVRGNYTGSRYFTTDNDPFSKLDDYFIMDATLGREVNLWQCKVNAALNVYNVFDTEYMVIQSYPMPMRTFTFSLSMEI